MDTKLEGEARRYVAGVASLLVADSRAASLLGTDGEDDDRQADRRKADRGAHKRVAELLRSLLADSAAWPASAHTLRDYIEDHLDTFTGLLLARYATRVPSSSSSLLPTLILR